MLVTAIASDIVVQKVANLGFRKRLNTSQPSALRDDTYQMKPGTIWLLLIS